MTREHRKSGLGLLIASAIGVSVWLLYWLTSLLIPRLEVSSFWWWFGFPLMLFASWFLGDRFRHKAWRLGVVMMLANFVVAVMLVPGAGNLFPFPFIIYGVMA